MSISIIGILNDKSHESAAAILQRGRKPDEWMREEEENGGRETRRAIVASQFAPISPFFVPVLFSK